MLSESFVASTLTTKPAVAHTSAALKDVGIFQHELQPQSTFRLGFKKSSSRSGCVTISGSHIYAAQADKAVVNVYSREKGNQEATVPFPERIYGIVFAEGLSVLVLGTEEGRLILWEVATGRLKTSAASHLQAISALIISPRNEYIISGSSDTDIHIWSLARLASFKQESDGFRDRESFNAPLRSFSSHRTGISALGCGHSKGNTNFVVSASTEGICHIWHMETCQLLRTILLPINAICVAVDPADRVIYFGGQNGAVFSWAIYQESSAGRSALRASTKQPSHEIQPSQRWTAPSSDPGAANCLTLTYDGAFLLSGHTNGAVVRWDVAKQRVLNEITNLGQSVTNIEMLRVGGLDKTELAYTIPHLVKPNLEFSAQTESGSCGIPSKYNFHAQISGISHLNAENEFEQALNGPTLSQSLIDDALRALESSSINTPASRDVASESQAEKLESEIVKLRQQLAAVQYAEEKRRARKLVRSEKRAEIGLKRREAYFAAKRQGKDGDAAMKKWEEQEVALDIESDDEALGEKMDLG